MASKRHEAAYRIAMEQFANGVSVESMKKVLKLKEEEEDFHACAGIRDAIERHLKRKPRGSKVA